MDDSIEFSLVKHYPVERRYILLKPMAKSIFGTFAQNLFKRTK